QESVSTGGNDYFHAATRVNFIIGENDPAMQCISSDYYNRLRTNGTPLLAYQIAPGTPHPVYSTDIGRTMIKAAILGLTLSSPVSLRKGEGESWPGLCPRIANSQ